MLPPPPPHESFIIGSGTTRTRKKIAGDYDVAPFFSQNIPPPPPLLRERCARGYAVTRRQHNIDTAIIYYFHTRMVVAVADDPNPDDDGKSPANPNPSPISSYCRLLLPRFVVDVENNRLPMPPSPKPPPPPSSSPPNDDDDDDDDDIPSRRLAAYIEAAIAASSHESSPDRKDAMLPLLLPVADEYSEPEEATTRMSTASTIVEPSAAPRAYGSDPCDSHATRNAFANRDGADDLEEGGNASDTRSPRRIAMHETWTHDRSEARRREEE